VAFDKLTNRQKRQEIAFDALNLLLSNVIIAQSGSYWGGKLNDIQNKSTNEKDFQENLCKIKTKEECFCCARGALMLSTIRLGNSISPNSPSISDGDENNIKGFNYIDFREMEAEFEGYDYNGSFYDEGSNKKLANILCNIIANGNYKIKDEKDYITLWELKVKEYENYYA